MRGRPVLIHGTRISTKSVMGHRGDTRGKGQRRSPTGEARMRSTAAAVPARASLRESMREPIRNVVVSMPPPGRAAMADALPNTTSRGRPFETILGANRRSVHPIDESRDNSRARDAPLHARSYDPLRIGNPFVSLAYDSTRYSAQELAATPVEGSDATRCAEFTALRMSHRWLSRSRRTRPGRSPGRYPSRATQPPIAPSRHPRRWWPERP